MGPVDCSGITAAGYELCTSSETSCEAVYTDGAGCAAVCAAAGLECESAAENVDDLCAADTALPALGCDSGHQSDYCICSGALPGGAGGSGGAVGSDGDAGADGKTETSSGSSGSAGSDD